jgi:hypothetical protein
MTAEPVDQEEEVEDLDDLQPAEELDDQQPLDDQLPGEDEIDDDEVGPLGEKEAEELTKRIDRGLTALADAYDTVMPLIREAYDRGAYEALGYESHKAYLKDRFGGSLAKLSPHVRKLVVDELTKQGLSTRDIANLTATNQSTVSRDRKAKSDANASPKSSGPSLPAGFRGDLRKLKEAATNLEALVRSDRLAEYRETLVDGGHVAEIEQLIDRLEKVADALHGKLD